MPIVDLDPMPFGAGIDRPEKGFVTPGEEERPAFKALTEATFRQENILGSAAQVATGIDATPDPEFKPFDQIKGTPYEQHFESFLEVQNRPQFDEVKRRLDREIEDRKIIDASPWWMSVPASLLANVTDPTMLAPGGAFVRGAKGGFSILKSAGAVGGAAGGATALQESFLQGTQETRTLPESLFNIGGSVVLGGLLGGGGSALLSKAEWSSAVKAMDHELAGFGQTPASIRDNPVTAPIYTDIAEKLRSAKPAWMGEEEIDKYAALTAARYQARAERLGGEKTALDIFHSEGIEIRGPGAPEAQGRAFDQAATHFAEAAAQSVQPSGRILIADLAERLALPLPELHALLRRLQAENKIVLYRMDNQREVTPRDTAAALSIGGEPRHLLYVTRADDSMALSAGDVREVLGAGGIPPGAVQDGTAYRLPIKGADGGAVGDIKFEIDALNLERGPNIRILGSQIVAEANRGKGYAIKAYQDLADFALSTGRQLWSDRNISPAAARIYAALEKRGYKIERLKDQDAGHSEAEFKVVAGPRSFNQAQPGRLDELRAQGFDVDRPQGKVLFQSQPAFFSAVSRAVAEAKQAKASPDQWLGPRTERTYKVKDPKTGKEREVAEVKYSGILGNLPGVKPEEIEWLGLPEWIASHKRPGSNRPPTITKEELQDFIRANQIEVKEVSKGAPSRGDAESRIAAREELAQFEHDMAAKYGEEWQMRMTVDEENQRASLDDQTRTEGATKYSQWQLPGGENYRELLLTLPPRDEMPWRLVAKNNGDLSGLRTEFRNREEAFNYYQTLSRDQRFASEIMPARPGPEFTASHWDEPNVLAHIRFNDRTIDGKRTLFIEEIQSDWHQAGKKKGYSKAKTWDVYDANGQRRSRDLASRENAEALAAELRGHVRPGSELIGGVPDAPFKTSWPELSLKRMLRYASENGYEQIAWTPGKVQAKRYPDELRKSVDNIAWKNAGPDFDGKATNDKLITLKPTGGGHDLQMIVNDSGVITYSPNLSRAQGKHVEDVFGKDMSRSIMEQASGDIASKDFVMGAKGMEGFYDQILPAAANKLGKKYGARVGEGKLKADNAPEEVVAQWEARDPNHPFVQKNRMPVHTLPITPELRDAAMGGFPLFQRGGEGETARGRITLASNKAIIDLFASADRSTFMHEMGHLWLDELVRDAQLEGVPQALKDDLGTVLRWLGVAKAEDIGTAQHEQWARAFEVYLAEGKAPSSALAKAFAQFKDWLLAIYRSLRDMGGPVADDIRAVMDRMLATDAEIKASQAYGPGSVGAAAVRAPDIAQASIAGRAAGGVAYATQRLNPGLRLAHSESPEVRNIGMNLAEMSQYLRGNQDGLASPVAVETLRKEWNGGLMTAVADTRTAYKEYRKGGGTLSRSDFQAAVGRAMRRGDEDPIPEVSKVAKSWRKNVFDPLKEAAIEAKLLPEDVSVDTAISYFSRLWNRQKLVAQEGEFKRVVMDWVSSNLPRWEIGFDMETAAKAAKMEGDKRAEFLLDRRLERDAMFGDPRDMGRNIADEVFDKLTGKTSEGVRPEFITIKARGPLKERTFNIPDELVERWLEDDVDLVGRRYSRIMSADVELARKFGSVDLKDQIAQIGESYKRLRSDVTDERRLTALDKQERADIRDIEAVRDIIRGTYAQSGWEKDFGRVVRIANNVQYILKMGQVVLSSLTEPVRVVAAKGLLPFMQDAFNGLTHPSALKMSIQEARLAGNINDKILAHRLSTVADLTDYYGSRGPVEKFLDNMTNVASSWNGIRLWTDGVKMLASTMIQNKILRTTLEYGAATAPDKRYLSFLGIDQSMAERIAKQFDKNGEVRGGVHIAGTENWTDEVARRRYRAALNKDMDSMVVTRGAADLPLFANTPLGRLIFQFNSFNLASHQRVLLRGLQEGHARFLSGVVALASLGMLQTYLTALATNSVSKLPDFENNRGWWISEGLDKSGMFMVPMQIANGVEKLTGINPIKSPIKVADEGRTLSQKNRNRNELGVLGPSAGTIQDIGSVVGVAKNVIAGEDITKAQKNAGERLLPFNSYYGLRQILKYFVNPPNE